MTSLDSIRTRQNWLDILRDSRIRPSRTMGQNFLVEPSVVVDIAAQADVGDGDLVVEIGPGMGVLTRELLVRGARVVGVELDMELAAFLREDMQGFPRFSLVEHDARHVDVQAITQGQPFQVVANLPYSIATVVIRHLVESANPPERLTVMVQREVAERMTASPTNMSLLGLATQFYSEAEIAFLVPPDVFVPPPKVQSAVVNMIVHQELALDPAEREWMFQLATMAFQRKRKTIANGLSQGLDRGKGAVESMLLDAQIDAGLRPQALSVEDWIRLSQVIPE